MDNEEKVGDADAVVRAMAYLGGVPGTRCDMIEMNREREQALRKIWATAEAAIDLVAPPRVMEMRVTADGRLTFYTSSSLEPEVATACPARLKQKVDEYIRNHPVQMSLEYFNDMQTHLKLKPKANKAEDAEEDDCDAEDVEHDQPEGDAVEAPQRHVGARLGGSGLASSGLGPGSGLGSGSGLGPGSGLGLGIG